MADNIDVPTLARRLDRHLNECVKVRIETLQALKKSETAITNLTTIVASLKSDISTIKNIPLSLAKWLLPVILAATVSGIISNWLAHEDAVNAARLAINTAVTNRVVARVQNRKVLEKLDQIAPVKPQ